MSEQGDRRLASILGVLGAVLIALDGVLKFARGVFDLAVGRWGPAYAPIDQALIFLLLGLIVGVFSLLGGARGEGRATVSGAVLVVLVIAGWLVLGIGSGILATLGSVLVLVAGVVFLVSGR